MHVRKQHGFSLLELSIVLVIIGLITGGIMAGRSMVRAAELRSVMSDVGKYQSAINTFREKYMGLPGDLKNATQYWGRADGGTPLTSNCATPLTDLGTGTATCNGDGNGTLPYSSGSEIFRFWQHLANAGLIEGQYTGVPGSGSTIDGTIGTNIPASRITGAGYAVYSWPNTVLFGRDLPNSLFFGAKTAISIVTTPIITSPDAYSIDSKLDDGMPATGFVVGSYASGGGSCTTTTVATTAAYNLTASGNVCSLLFQPLF